MKLLVGCAACAFPEDGSEGRQRVIALVELRDDNLYESVCAKGHRSFTVLQNYKWDLMFDSGALALRDGYHRESVASCAGALEEFYAFYVRVVLRAHGIPVETIEKFGKQTRLSERRLGAMHLAYALENKTPFTLDDEKQRAFRNKVIHDGYWASREEAVAFARYVFDLILVLFNAVKTAHPEALSAEQTAPLAKGHALARDKSRKEPAVRYTTSAMSTMLNASMAATTRSFDDAFKSFSGWNVWDGVWEIAAADEARANDSE